MEVLPQTSPAEAGIARLDLKDRRIIYMLSGDARMPLSRIAKAAKLSRDSVKYRINGYEKAGVLKGTMTAVDVSKLGYGTYHVFVKLNSPSGKAEKAILGEICALPSVRVVLKFFGSYDLEVAVIAKSFAQFDSILTGILSQLERFVKEYEIAIITSTYVSYSVPGSFFKELNLKKDTFNITKIVADYLPDKKDMRLIRKIANDARMPLADIAHSLDTSPDAIGYRLNKLVESKIISFRPVINYKSIGYTTHVLLLNIMPLDSTSEKRLHSILASDENILWAVKTLGRFNVLAYVCTRDSSELQGTINRLREEFAEKIKQYEILLAAGEYKYTYAPECLFE